MTSESSTRGSVITLDPRTEELLREIAAAPGACVLRASRAELEAALTRSDYCGLDTRIGFSSAERELLRTARHELAYWLNVLAYRRLTEDESTRRYYTRLGAGDREYVPPSDEDIATGSRAAMDSAGELRVDAMTTLEVLQAAVTPLDAARGRGRPGVVELAAASLRLHPTFQARHYALQARVVEGDVRSVLPVVERLAETCAGRNELGHSLALAGTLNGLSGRFNKALHCYMRAAELLPDQTELIIRALVAAWHLGDAVTQDSLLNKLQRRREGESVWRTLLGGKGLTLGALRSPRHQLMALVRTSSTH